MYTNVPGLPQKYMIPEEGEGNSLKLQGQKLLLTQGHPSASGSQGLGFQWLNSKRIFIDPT